MLTGRHIGLLGQLRCFPTSAIDDRLLDSELLRRFQVRGDPNAFAAIVSRHGRMVYNLCRRVLCDHHDAEDAFQATFLVLARKAHTIRPGGMLANWLYGVALRTARDANSRNLKRRMKEGRMRAAVRTECVEKAGWDELQPVLDEELGRLPDAYRTAIVLCDLEGKTRKEAARELGWLEGTLSGRLARARRMLAKRLSRRGISLSAAILALLVSTHAAKAAPPITLIRSTVKAGLLIAVDAAVLPSVVAPSVVALTKGVIRTMFIAKLKTALMTVAVLSASILAAASIPHEAPAQTGPANTLTAAPAVSLKVETMPGEDLNEGLMIEPWILSNKTVVKQANMTAAQQAKVVEAFETLQEKHRDAINQAIQDYASGEVEEAQKVFLAFAEDWRKTGNKVLETEFQPQQVRRIREIDLQWRGPIAFREVHVVRKLKLSAQQRQKLNALVDDMLRDLDRLRAKFGSDDDPRKIEVQESLRALWTDYSKQCESLLDDNQKSIWKTMRGEILKVEFDSGIQVEGGEG